MLGHLLRLGLSSGLDAQRLVTLGLAPGRLCYNLYRGLGDSLANVDFTAPVATITSPMEAETLVGLVHEPGTSYTYVLRPVLDGLETPAISCRVLFETDASGEWVGSRPAAPQAPAAAAGAGGTVRLSWSYRTPSGQPSPVDFALYLAAEPAIAPGEPQAIAPYTVDGRYTHTFTPPAGQTCWLAVTARGPAGLESPLSAVVGPLLAVGAGPQQPSFSIETTF